MVKVRLAGKKWHVRWQHRHQTRDGVAECDWERRRISLDPRRKGKDLLDDALHEAIHAMNPEMAENIVRRQAGAYAAILWSLNFRRVENDA